MHELDPRYLEGIRLFNAGEFFACHDVLEELWGETLGPERSFYQGLIHAAVALHHFETDNLGGARKMYESARRYLEPYGPAYLGLDVERFLDELRECFRELIEAGNVYPAGTVLDAARVPRLHHSRTSEAN
jgi:predicted metal-dependent hydrolase